VKCVDDPVGERFLGTDDREADLLLLGEADQLVELVDVDRDVDAVGRRPGVARRAEDALDAWRLGELPDQGVFPPALADHQDFHETPIAVRRSGVILRPARPPGRVNRPTSRSDRAA
jgi:hypothetical protein